MGKSDEKQAEKRAHKATDGEIKHKIKPSADTTLEAIPEVTTSFNAKDDGGLRHSQWRDHFRQVCEYKAIYGHCRVPLQYTKSPKLGAWVRYQRTRYRKYSEGKPASRTAEHIRALESIGFDWGTSKVDLSLVWNVRFQQMVEFKAQVGHCLVPQGYSVNPKLGKWVHYQRNRYREYMEDIPSSMTKERIEELESVGFVWDASAAIWNERFEQLRQYKLEFGHCRVLLKYEANPKLGKWVKEQRYNGKLYKEGRPSRMTAKRLQQLEFVGFR